MIIATIGKPIKGEELAWSELSSEELVSLASTSALFGGAQTFILEGALRGSRAEEFLNLFEVFAVSPHTFVFSEEKLLKTETEALKEVGAQLIIEKVVKKEYRFDNFGAAEALGKKDKKGLWLALMTSWRAGEKPEAVAGLLCWKARQMKHKQLSRQLVRLYHDSHRGVGELELLLEHFALKL
jgi:DNA polymerase III delta subunit